MDESSTRERTSEPPWPRVMRWSRGRRRSVDRGTRRPAIELRNQSVRDADAVKPKRKATSSRALSRALYESRAVEDPVHAWKLFAPEQGDPVGARRGLAAGRSEKVSGRTPDMYADGKSDGCVVPMKPPNNDGLNPSAEVVEGRRPTKGNTLKRPPRPGRRAGPRTSIGLDGCVKQVPLRTREGGTVHALLHHVTSPTAARSFYALKREAAPGVDGVTWRSTRKTRSSGWQDLHDADPSRAVPGAALKRIYIPKADGTATPAWASRPWRTKSSNRPWLTVLNADLRGGLPWLFLWIPAGRAASMMRWTPCVVGITAKEVNWVLDADIQAFFDTIDHDWLMKFLEHRIADRRIFA